MSEGGKEKHNGKEGIIPDSITVNVVTSGPVDNVSVEVVDEASTISILRRLILDLWRNLNCNGKRA